ncbi:MAG: hypothetical protein IKV79_05605 [Oscillospiraceae bacterium]|nr:hypothetical protein [Oscillospiraceae bacterium]
MKKHLSVFMLMARSCIYKIMLIMAAMAAVEIFLTLFLPNPRTQLLYDLIDLSRIRFVYYAAISLAVFTLISCCSVGSSNPRHTIERLSVSERWVIVWHWLTAALALFALWFWQIILLYGISLWHSLAAESGYISQQSIFLANFRSDFFHSVLPLEDMSRLLRNIIMFICMGGVCASSAHKIRRGKKMMFAALMHLIFLWACFAAEAFEASYDGFLIFAYALIFVLSIVGVCIGSEEVDYEEATLEN